MRTKQLLCFLTAVLVLLLFTLAAQGKGRPFITRWKGEAGKELQIPINGQNCKVVIKKADGTVLKTESYNFQFYRYSFTPTEDGELLVEAGPEGVTSFQMTEDFVTLFGSPEALLRVEQFGTVQWQTMRNAFVFCKNMQFASGIDTPDLSKVTNMRNMFRGCTSFNQPLNSWNVSKVTNMRSMFFGCTSFNQPLNSWNVSKVTNMRSMFFGCTSFNQPLNSWNVSKVTNMRSMFFGCTSFNQPLNSWNVSKVTNMRSMFVGCTSFNQPLNSWDVCQVTDMWGMFQGCTSFNQPLNNWDVSKVTFMREMFFGCTSFNQPLNNWNVSQVADMGSMFQGCTAFNQPLSNWDVSQVWAMWCMFSGCTSFNQSLNNWAVSQVIHMAEMFLGCTSFNQPLNNWDVSQVKYMGKMFFGCTSFNQSLSNWDVSKVSNMEDIFSGCTSFNHDLGMWKLEKCEELDLDNCGMNEANYSKSLVGWAEQANIKQGLYLSARGLKYNARGKAARKKLIESKNWRIIDIIDENGRPFITRWKGEAGKELRIPITGHNYKLVIKKTDGTILKTVPSLTNHAIYQFTPSEDGELLIEAGPVGVRSFQMSGIGSAAALLRVEQFGTVEWQTMQSAFVGCKNMQFAEGIDTPDLGDVTDMNGMFRGCTSFNQPLNSWDVSQVTDMRDMFFSCTSFNQPLNSWDVSKVTYINGMFRGCTSFNHDLGMWKLEKCEELDLDNCGMSVENYSRSLEGWAAQADIKQSLRLSAKGLKYNASGKAARKHLIREKWWSIRGDIEENGRPFITRWKGEAGKELYIPIKGENYKLVIKKADGTVLKTETSLITTSGEHYYQFTPTETGELLVEAGPEGVTAFASLYKRAEALLYVEQFGTVQWQTM